MKPERRTPRPPVSVTATVAQRYRVSPRLAQLAVSRAVHIEAAELADRDADPSRGFTAAVNVLARRPVPPRFPPFAVLLDRCGVTP